MPLGKQKPSILETLKGIWTRLLVLCRACVTLRGSLLSALVGIGVMQAGQMQEVAAVLMEDFVSLNELHQLTFAIVAILIVSFALWFAARSFTVSTPLEAVPDINNQDTKRYGYFLALLPGVIASGYLAYNFRILWRHMWAAGLGGSYSGAFVLTVLILAAAVFVVTSLMVVVGVFREPKTAGTIDKPLTHWFFAGEGAPSSDSDTVDDPIGLFLLFMRFVRRFLQRLGGGAHPLNFLARIYGLHDPAKVRPGHSSKTASAPVPGPPARVPPAGQLTTLSGVPGVFGPGADTFLARPPQPTGKELASQGWAEVKASFAVVRKSLLALQFALVGPLFLLTITVPVLLVAATAAFFGQAPGWPEYIGSLAIAQIFVMGILIAFTVLHYHTNALIVLAIAAVGFAACDLNDTHHIRPLAGTPTGSPSLAGAFPEWLDARKDLDEYSRYPVYIVAARGGGIYAAYHSAIFLSRMQDICPGFAQHIFAISSVSGGSLGAGVFAALASAHATNAEHRPCDVERKTPGPFEEQTRQMLAHDFLSPVVSAALFPDLVLQVIPACPVYPWCLKGFDRARPLELAFENVWADVTQPAGTAVTRNPLAESFYALWSAGGATPGLLVNTTNVETGGRVVISPFRDFITPGSRRGGQVTTLLNSARDLDLRLSTAMGISARFPILTPAAWYRFERAGETPMKARLVDGGYFDNSGIATALDAIEALTQTANEQNRQIDVRLIVLTGTQSPLGGHYAFSEVLSVVRALLNTRDEHGRRIEQLARSRVTAGPSNASLSMMSAVLDTGAHVLPLGWQLSTNSRRAIEDNTGRPGAAVECLQDGAAQNSRPRSPLDESSCTMSVIRNDLNRPR